MNKYLLCAILVISPIFARAALPFTGDPPSLAPMLQAVTPAVVNISTRGSVKVNNPFFQQFFGRNGLQVKRRTQSLGSGVIVNADAGYILTNHHVIEHASEITITLADSRILQAQLVGSDPDTDLALIKVEAENLTELPLASERHVSVGDFVVAIGNPFGLGQTVTSGIVSAVGRSGLGVERLENFIQTDASINPGNSGGALVNFNGELIGINTAIIGPSGGSVGIGFAIPANISQQILQDLSEYGEVRRGSMGVMLQPVTQALADALTLTEARGALIVAVHTGSSAETAGLQPGDVVMRINQQLVHTPNDLINAIGLARVGSQIEVEFERDGQRYLANMTL